MSTDRERSLREVSYGGVTVRGDQVLVITPSGKPPSLLALPKGGAAVAERGEDAAAREVLEETGVTVEVVEELGRVEYWYRRSGRSVFKTVHFYLCRHVSGEPAPDGVEVSQARWIPLAQAPQTLAYKGEREMAERALSKLAAER